MKPEPWNDQFAKNLIAKGSITPPPRDSRYMPGWFVPLLALIAFVGAVLAFTYGVYVK